MEVVSKATNSHGALLVPLDGTRLLFPHTRSMEPSVETYHRDGWNQRDERFRGVDLMMRRGVVTDLDFFTEEAILRHPYYQEFLAPHGLRWFAGVKIACGDVQWALSLQRRIDQGPFNAEEQDTLKALSRQLAGAAAIVRALGLARAESALSAFELSGTAVALVGRTGNVMSVNPAAERLLGQDVYIRLGRLTSRNVAATAALDRALSALLCSPAPVAMLPPIALPRIGRRPILAYPARLSDVTADALGPCQALVVLVDLESRRVPP
jgi:PAS domain-containing protein